MFSTSNYVSYTEYDDISGIIDSSFHASHVTLHFFTSTSFDERIRDSIPFLLIRFFKHTESSSPLSRETISTVQNWWPSSSDKEGVLFLF
jgi:hypothetical protein